jgi:beta-xylosidase
MKPSMKRIYLAIPLWISLISINAQESHVKDTEAKSGNPLFPGWYADPEAIIYGNKYWIYPTFSGYDDNARVLSHMTDNQIEMRKNTINPQYLKQIFIDAFSSDDLITWQKHPSVIDITRVKWAAFAMWAPSVIMANDKYYLLFGANDIQNDGQYGGIGVAVSDKPEGPFEDALGKPLISKIVNGAQPIDQFVFRDTDGQLYLFYGGWRHCNVARLSADLLSLIPFDDGSLFKEVTPPNYVEGPFMLKRKGRYYMMWSEGGWQGPNYSVAYAISDSPLGPFNRIGKILQQDPEIATGAGHHSVIQIPDTDEWYIVYHRRPLGEHDGNHRVTCIDQMFFDEEGFIIPVRLTNEGVTSRPLKR